MGRAHHTSSVLTFLALSVVTTASFAAAAPRTPVWHKDALPHAKPEHAPQRIVSLAPVVTETLFDLGAGARVVGDTRFCDRPVEAQKLPKVGGYVDISLEQVLSLKPDLVVAMPSLGQRDVLDRVRERGIPVLVVFGDTLAEVHGLTRALGNVVGNAPAAARLEASLDDAARGLSTLASSPRPAKRAVVVVGLDPLVVAGPGTFAADALSLAGLALATPDNAPMWPVWSPESLASQHLDIVIAANGADDATKLTALLARALPLDKRPRVLAADRAILMRPGPALIEDLATLAALLRPVLAASSPTPTPATSPTPSTSPTAPERR